MFLSLTVAVCHRDYLKGEYSLLSFVKSLALETYNKHLISLLGDLDPDSLVQIRIMNDHDYVEY